MLRIIQKSFHLGSAFKVFVEYGSKVVKEHINNEIGSILYYNGTPPQFYTPQTVHPEFFQHLEWLIRSSYEEAGISQFTAMSKVPKGIDGGSGKAIREYNEMESERFALVSQSYEASFLKTAEIYIDLAKELKEEHGIDIETRGEAGKFLEKIKWSEVDLDRDSFMMKLFPTSMLPRTPAGKLAYVQELINAGFVDRLYGMKLLEFPDTDEFMNREIAALEDILYTLNEILNKGNYLPPEPYQALELGKDIFQKAYLQARQNNAPEDRLELIRQWLQQVDAMQQQAAMAMQAQQMQAQQMAQLPTAEQQIQAGGPQPGAAAQAMQGAMPPEGAVPPNLGV